MNPVKFFAQRPVAVAVVILLVILFGYISIRQIPVQLTPEVAKPEITVSTAWPGAAPQEVESEIIIPQEEQLKSVPGLDSIESTARYGNANIVLGFRTDTDINSTLVLVSNRLQQVREYPEEAFQPTIRSANLDDSPIVWIMLQRKELSDISSVAGEFEFVDRVIVPALERIPGVAGINVHGGRARQLQITVEPAALAARGISIPELVKLLRAENLDLSGGRLDEGKNSYTVRATGSLRTPELLRSVVVRSGAAGVVTLGDIARIEFGLAEPLVDVRGNGRSMIAINIVKERGANVLEIMDEVRATLAWLNREKLQPRGLELNIRDDQTEYINAAIKLVTDNLVMGSLLAIGILWLFLRSVSAIAIISVTIPVAVLGAFVVMAGGGRTINVISLAGLAFAVGMVVDPAIVALENMIRLRDSGMTSTEAAIKGSQQVWGANFIATATTVMVFLPVLWLDIEATQLFRDIAVAICAAILWSLAAAATLIPAMGVRLLSSGSKLRSGGMTRLADWVANVAGWVNRSRWRQLVAIVSMVVVPLVTVPGMIPPAEYLPQGNRNLVFAMLLPPPGYNLEEMTRLAREVERRMEPYWNPDHPEFSKDGAPTLRSLFFAARGSMAFSGGVATDPERIGELVTIMRQAMQGLPGTIGIVNQASIFSKPIGRGRSLDLEVSGTNMDTIAQVARELFKQGRELLPGAQIRPIPGLEPGGPEVRFLPDRVRIAENGLTTAELGQIINTYTDGMVADRVVIDDRELDIVIQSPVEERMRTQDLAALPLVNGHGEVIPLGALGEARMVAGPVQIERRDREQVISLRINPVDGMALEEAVNLVREKLVTPAREKLPPGVSLRISQGADELNQAKEAMAGQFGLAVVITYLLMAALFESFLYPLAIIATVPLAAVGGVWGLGVLNWFVPQSLDVLTMLGFVILTGVVVNNAILIVHQALNFMSEDGMAPSMAVVESTRIRVRPIFMSTLTSIFGMLPLVLFPGAGSELYRGLGSVFLGGLVLTTVFTLFLTPALFGLSMELLGRGKKT